MLERADRPSILKKKRITTLLDTGSSGSGSFGGLSGSQIEFASPSFYLPFDDLGAGQVSLVETRYGATPTFTRATTATTVLSNGLIGSVASGVPRSYYDPSTFSSNLYVRSEEFDNASWLKLQSGTGSVPVVTANAGASPNGDVSADRVVFALNGGTTTSDRSQLQQNMGNQEPGFGFDGITRTKSVYMKSFDGVSSYDIQLRINGASSVVTVTPEWQRFSVSGSAVNGDNTVWITLRGGLVPATSDSADILMWGAQVNYGSAPTTYIPTTSAVKHSLGAYRRYLAEGARTNLCLQSEDFGTTWVNVRSSESLNAAVAPTGSAVADKLIEDSTAAATHSIVITQPTIVADSTQTISAFFKAGERTWVLLQCSDATLTNAFGAYFDLAGGVTGADDPIGVGTVASKSIQAFPGGWYRCAVAGAVNGGVTAAGIRIYTANADNGKTYDGDGASGLYCWGMQQEAATFASSYIPTTTASVTRNADVLTYSTTGWCASAVGTFFAEFSANQWPVASEFVRIINLTATPSMPIILRHTNGIVRADDGTNVVGNRVYTVGTVGKVALAYANNDAAMSFTGQAVQTQSTWTASASPTALDIGQTGGTNFLFGTIGPVAYWPRRIQNQLLQEWSR